MHLVPHAFGMKFVVYLAMRDDVIRSFTKYVSKGRGINMTVRIKLWDFDRGTIIGMLFLMSLMVLMGWFPATLLAQDELPAENLTQLVATALAENPELKASEARWKMFSNRIEQARSFEDPMLMLKIQNGIVRAPLDFGREPMTSRVIGISQQLPFWGKRALKGQIAEKEAESYKWNLEERKLELVRMVKETYYQVYYIDRSLAIVKRSVRLLDDFITLADTRYAVGQGPQQDVFKARVERSRLLEASITLAQQRVSVTAALNELLARPAATPVGTIDDVALQPVSLNAEQLFALAEENQPLLKSSRALIEKANAGLDLAKKEFFPDVAISLEYMQRDPVNGSDGLDMYTLGLTFNLPVQRTRRQAAVAESSAEIRMASEELRSQEYRIRTGIADFLTRMEQRRQLAELYRSGIIPQARQSLESAVIGYRVGTVDFLALLNSMVTLFSYEREYHDSLADYQVNRVRLEALVGKTLP